MGTHFLVSMVAGLLLAIGFQYVLTTLSVAAGAAGAARRVTRALGLWALVTASLALFFASWLAVELSLAADLVAGAVLGLVVWALFQVVVVSFEGTAAWSPVGTLARTAGVGPRGAWRASTSVPTASPGLPDTATEVTRAVREEATAGVEVDRLREEIGRCIRQVATQPFDAETIRRQVVEALDDVELRAVVDLQDLDREALVARFRARHDWDAERAGRAADAVQDAVGEVREQTRAPTARPSGGQRLAVQPIVLHAARDRALSGIEDRLDELGRPELAYEGVRRDMLRLFEDPRAGADALVTRLRAFDRDTIRALLGATPGMTSERAERFVDTVLRARDEVVTATERVRYRIERRVRAAREQAARDAEAARRNAVTAAWWGFGTAIVSGGAAAAGGIVAVLT